MRKPDRSRCSCVVVEQPTKTFVPTHPTDTPIRTLTVNQFVVQPLMIPLAMIMGDKFRDSPSMMALPERNQAVQTFLFDRADEPFGVGVCVRRPIGCLDDAEPRVLQAHAHRPAPLGIPVADLRRRPARARPPARLTARGAAQIRTTEAALLLADAIGRVGRRLTFACRAGRRRR
jgi:hypothetical protein